jgi:hypothetical protein
MGIDGEGCGRNRKGQQHFRLLRAGPFELYKKGKPLRTLQILDWICDLPAEPLLVGFAFGYDTTQMLRDLPAERLSNAVKAKDGTIIKPGTGLFDDKPAEAGRSRYTYFEDYGIEYLPKNYLRVCRIKRGRVTLDDGRTYMTRVRVEGTTRTIYETFGFFQKSFLKALQDFGIGEAYWATIERNKENRSEFVRITREIREYNRIECELLAELMETFREVCHGNGLRPRTWNGAGKLAAYMHGEHGTPTAERVASSVPNGVLRMAADAYYGGRFEVTRIGEVPGPIHEADIGSAYPAAMRELPCLLHGTWEPFEGKPPPSGFYVAYAAFSHAAGTPVCGLPIRKHDGRLFWPREGQGTYWSPELRSAGRLGAKIHCTAGWRYITNCECRPFDWIDPIYAKRKALDKDRAGYPLKLGLASLYGKLAQRIGNPRWGNLVWAGLITSITRAWLNDAARQAPDSVVMFATDAIFSKVRLDLAYGDGLGEWEAKQHDRLFVVQPGIYFGASRPKTRGVPASLFVKHVRKFERQWALWCGHFTGHTGPPVVAIPVPLFTGLRLAHARGKPETAGKWTDGKKYPNPSHPNYAAPRKFSFDWSRKRDAVPLWETPICVRTMPAAGAPDLVSVSHKANPAWHEIDEDRMEYEDQPDHVDLSPVV